MDEIKRTYEITIDNKYDYYIIESCYKQYIQPSTILNKEYSTDNVSDINDLKHILNNDLNIIL